MEPTVQSSERLPDPALQHHPRELQPRKMSLAEKLYLPLFGGMMVDRTDIGHLLNATKSATSMLHAAGLMSRYGLHRLRFSRGARLVMGNALVGHSDGFISPAAQFAFQRAATIAPAHPGPPFFMGLALAQSGRLAEARTIWAQLASRAPPGAPWKADLDERLVRLDSLIAQAGR